MARQRMLDFPTSTGYYSSRPVHTQTNKYDAPPTSTVSSSPRVGELQVQQLLLLFADLPRFVAAAERSRRHFPETTTHAPHRSSMMTMTTTTAGGETADARACLRARATRIAVAAAAAPIRFVVVRMGLWMGVGEGRAGEMGGLF